MKYRWKTKPYKHQIKAVKAGLASIKRSGGFAMLMEPRTGKTKTAIDLMCILHKLGKVNRVLIVCPGAVIGVWEDELITHATCKYKVTIWDKNGRKRTLLPPYGRDTLDIVIINYEAFQTPGQFNRKGVRTNRGGRFDIRNKLRAWKPHLMILDESHRIKSSSAKRTRMIVSIAWKVYQGEKECLVPYRFLMTGTVVTKKKRVYDIYSQWKYLNPNSELVAGHTLATYKEEYSRRTHRNGYPQWLNNKNLLKLRRLLHEDSYAVTRAECFDLPPRLPDEIIKVHLDETQSGKVYQDMAEEMIAKIHSGEITEASIRLVQSMRLAQITSGLARTIPSDEFPEGRLVRVGNEKLDAFRDWIVDRFEEDQKIVVGARWRGDIAAVVEMCQKLRVPCYELHGGVKSRTDRHENIRKFRVQQSPAVFLAQPAAGSLGIDLSTAYTGAWFSQTNSYVDFSQFEDRIALAKQSIQWTYFIAEGTVDELLYVGNLEDADVLKLIVKKPELLLGGGLKLIDK